MILEALKVSLIAWDEEPAGTGGIGANPAINTSGGGPSGSCYEVRVLML